MVNFNVLSSCSEVLFVIGSSAVLVMRIGVGPQVPSPRQTVPLEAPLLHSILSSNDVHIRHALALIDGSGAKRIGMLGVTFKTGTDDLRESPQLELVARLLDADVELRLYDRHITPAGISLAKAHSAASSAETRVALNALPDLLFPTAQDVVDWADIVVVAHATGESARALRASIVKPVLDLARLPTDLRARPGYVGVCW